MNEYNLIKKWTIKKVGLQLLTIIEEEFKDQEPGQDQRILEDDAAALEEDPYQGDDQTYQEHFRKTFITEN